LYAINHAEDKVIFCHKDFSPLLDKLQDRIQGVRKIVLLGDGEEELTTSPKYEGEYEALMSQQKEEYHFPDFDENSVATIFFTTGTTGLPKAVYFSHRQLVLHTLALTTTLAATNSIAAISSEDVYMPMTPMFHVHAWGMPYVATYLGMKQVYPGKYEPSVLLQLKRDEKVTVSHGVPTLLQMILNDPDVDKTDLAGWKITIGGSALTKGLATKLAARGVNLNVGYGMSETGPVIAISHIEKQTIATVSDDEQIEIRLKAGLPIHLSEVGLKNETGELVPIDGISQGEVVVRSPWAVKSYYNDPARSEELWKDGYLHTGDIATIDGNGVITVTDRIKDVIKSGGEWVPSSLLESLISSYDGVEDVAVVAIPDEKWTERPLAVIVPEPNESISKKKLFDYLQHFVTSGKIKSFAIPKDYDFVSDLPKTSAGKIDKKKIRAMVQNATLKNWKK
jgi:fatty-acyl-CoA synthase